MAALGLYWTYKTQSLEFDRGCQSRGAIAFMHIAAALAIAFGVYLILS